MFKYDLLIQNKESFEIETQGSVTLYNTDNSESLSNDIKDSENQIGIGLVFDTNNVGNSVSGVYFNNGVKTNNKRMISVGYDNFIKSNTYFTARRLVISNWINQKDEFLIPNKTHEKYQQFQYDSIVYSIFHSQNAVFSTNDKSNHFFWMSVEKMKQLSDSINYDELYNDARTSTDRHVYQLLFGDEHIYEKLSSDAKLIIDKATELVEKSMEVRQTIADDENCLDSWDAGHIQLKNLWKQYFPEDFKKFKQLYKNLEDRMRPIVYELGFLMN